MISLFLLQLNPQVPGLMESFATCCGSEQAGAGWIVSIMVKPEDERLIALGICCIFAYLRLATSDDHPVSIHTGQQEDHVGTSVTESSKTVALAASLAKKVSRPRVRVVGQWSCFPPN
jgi:hypothetical protein